MALPQANMPTIQPTSRPHLQLHTSRHPSLPLYVDLPMNPARIRPTDTQQGQDTLNTDIATILDENEAIKKEMELQAKKWATKERQLKQRETAVKRKEEEVANHDHQTVFLKATVNKLELQIQDLKEQNRMLELKLLANEDLRRGPPPNMHDPHPSPAQTQNSTLDLLAASMAALTATMIQNMEQTQHPHLYARPPPPTKIINIYNSPWQHRQPQYQRRHQQPKVYDYHYRTSSGAKTPGSDKQAKQHQPTTKTCAQLPDSE